MDTKDFRVHLLDSSLAQLGHGDGQVREKTQSILEDLILEDPNRAERVLERLADNDSHVRQDCVKLLGRLVWDWRKDPPAVVKGVVSALLKAVDDPQASVRRTAFRAFAQMRSAPEGWGTLLAQFAGDSDLTVRREAVRLLGNLRSDDQDVIHGLAAGLQDSDSQVRMEASIAFCYRSGWPPREPWLRSAFLEALEDSNPHTRSLALRGVWHTDWQAESSMAVFLKHLEDEDLEVRRSALNEILNVALNSPELARAAVPALLRALGNPQLARRAALALVKVAPMEPALHVYLKSLLGKVGVRATALCLQARAHVKEAVNLALHALRDSKWDTQLPFTAGVVHVTPRDTAAKALLEHALIGDVELEDIRSIDVVNNPILGVQMAAIILRLFPGDTLALRRVTEGLAHDKDVIREKTAWTLPHIICADPRVIPVALESLGSDLEMVRVASIAALSTIAKPPLEALPALTHHLGGGDAFQKGALLKLIASLGPEAASATEAVLDLMSTSEFWARGIVALSSIHAKHPACVSHYVRALDDDNMSLRMWAIVGLQTMRSAAIASLPAIAKVFADPNSEVRLRAVAAMVAVGREHPVTKVSLARVVVGDPEENVRRMAAYALGWLS
jgi:HEAT repeat protein